MHKYDHFTKNLAARLRADAEEVASHTERLAHERDEALRLAETLRLALDAISEAAVFAIYGIDDEPDKFQWRVGALQCINFYPSSDAAAAAFRARFWPKGE